MVYGLSFSIGNLEGLQSKQKEGELLIWLVALSYQSLEEVDVFLQRHQLNYPALFGDQEMAANYHIGAFPTYYVVDPAGKVAARSGRLQYGVRIALANSLILIINII